MRNSAAAGFAIVLTGLGPLASPSQAALRAEQIDERSAPELQIGGPDAIGGIGDWYLANDVVEVIVDDVGRAHGKLNHGGTLVDVGLVDREGEDQFARLFPLANLDQKVFLDFDAIRAEVDPAGGWARVVVSGRGGMSSLRRGGGLLQRLSPLVPDAGELRDVHAETEYAVFPGEPMVHITTTIRNDGERPAPVFAYGDVWMRGGRSMRAWVADTLAPEQSRGFHHTSFDRSNLLASTDAMAGSTYVALPGMRHFPPIAYAIFSPERAQRGERQFGVTGVHVSFINVFFGDSGWDDLGLARLLLATRRELDPGESWVYHRRLLVTGRSDVASTTDVIFPLLGFADGRSGVTGRVMPGDVPASLLVESAESWPVTQIAPAADGQFRAVLPPGDYALTLRASQRPPRRIAVSVEEGGFTEVAPLRLEEPGWLVFDPAFADGGPGRVIVRGLGETPDPVFAPELLDFRIDGDPVESGTETRELQFIGDVSDPRRVAIPPGRYRLTAVRSLEHDVEEREIEVPGAGAETRVGPFELARVIELAGAVRGDFHVHAQASDDSSTSNASRLRSFIAAGIDVIATTDHDHLGNYEPDLDALGVRDRIRVIQGVEVTSSAPSPVAPWTIGHHNAWPLPYAPLAHRRGAPESQNRSLAELYASLRSEYGAGVVQLNHPRDGAPAPLDEAGYFTHLATAGAPYDPTRPLVSYPNLLLLETASDGFTRALDFDAIEVMNGRSHAAWQRVRADWYSLLRQGFRRTGTANSDTHGPGKPAGYPRNYVLLDVGAVADESALVAAVRAGRLFGTTGPLISMFRVNGGSMGDLVSADRGRATVELAVAAAPWVPVDEVRLLVNGEVFETFADLADDETLRLERSVELALDGDAFVTVEAGAPIAAERGSWIAEHTGPYTEAVAPGYVAMAFSNPIFVDADGDGDFEAPGLPPPPPRRPNLAPWLVPIGLLVAWFAWRHRTS